jgi:hypothetical protein
MGPPSAHLARRRTCPHHARRALSRALVAESLRRSVSDRESQGRFRCVDIVRPKTVVLLAGRCARDDRVGAHVPHGLLHWSDRAAKDAGRPMLRHGQRHDRVECIPGHIHG